MIVKGKKPISASSKLKVTHVGPEQAYRLYLFSDVLEELTYYASQKNAWGLLSGQFYALPVDKTHSNDEKMDKPSPESSSDAAKVDNQPADLPIPPDYVEITAFRDIYPCCDALDYASYLRKMRNFRSAEDCPDVGPVCLMQQKREPMLEDLLLARSYFAAKNQAIFFISADNACPRAFVLDESLDHFEEVGIDIVSPADAGLPFDPA